MKTIMLLFLAVLGGCARNDWAEAADRKAYGALVEHSPAYLRARVANPRHTIWYVEQPGKTPQIYVGHDMGTHNARAATLRIRGGTV